MTEADPTADEPVLLERRGGIAIVTLNRPKVLNALNQALLTRLAAIIDAIAADAAVSGVIVTGAGEKAFAAGADIAELSTATGLEARAASARGQAIFNQIGTLGKPVVAAVNGFAFGGGCELAMACTLRVAAANALFGQPEVKLGLVPGYGGTQRLASLVGKGAAMKLVLTGEPIDAAEALRIGLVDEVVPAGSVVSRAEQIVSQIARNAPLAVRFGIEAINRSGDLGVVDGLALESAFFGLCAESEDKREGTAAFLEKRQAAFVGR